MKQKPVIQSPALCRQLLVEWYHSPQGESLRALESDFLSRAVSFRYNQDILQIGSLGWENDYRDQDCGYRFVVVDCALLADASTSRIIARCDQIPIESESIDVVVIPHSLEFETDPHGVLREAERVLKPEGQFILLGFNPWCLQSLYHFRQGRRGMVPWCGNFLSYPRMRDWLSLLNFEYSLKCGVYFRQSCAEVASVSKPLRRFTALGYGIKAIKRRYTLIPLKESSVVTRNLIPADVATTRYRSHG
ncbi:MAG: class I SAM-dependent methyltransferase [Methylococcaceae bacterium]|nr:class I SAM-dependent methyltransferase [Methylococcaceae bacterium]